jgi:NADH dehydrogenase FAD-containing subunit
MHAANSKVVAAQSILIMGGGPVAVEMAGEMVTDFADKKVKVHFLNF